MTGTVHRPLELADLNERVLALAQLHPQILDNPYYDREPGE